ncbi:methyltransferase domain-containing protein [Rhodopila sp.]|uniref:methyltransferase domain-containing protein n=1 Tax=Rhodopila sp. TaxID=2480087 RepID=UPI003D11C662
MSRLSPAAEKLRRQAQVAAGATDRERWEDATSYERFWSDRSAAAAKLCRSGQWVCDIGCGMQGLKAMLPAGCTYLPADLRRWEPVVETCDLNAGRLPERHLVRCDVVILLGVIEYIYDLPRLLAALARRAETVVVSYNCAELAEVDRPGFGWVNALTTEALLELLRQAGLQPNALERFGAMEILVRARNPGFGPLQRLRRRAARLSPARP